VTGDEFEFTLDQAAFRLLKSELYLTRLRRTLKNGWDPKVLTDFLVMDDVCLIAVSLVDPVSTAANALRNTRDEVFGKALKSAEKSTDVRVHDQVRKLEEVLLGRSAGTTADLVLDAVYGKPKSGRGDDPASTMSGLIPTFH